MENYKLLYVSIEIDGKRVNYVGPETTHAEVRRILYLDNHFVHKMQKMKNKTFIVKESAVVTAVYERGHQWEHYFGPEDTFTFIPDCTDGVFFKFTKHHASKTA